MTKSRQYDGTCAWCLGTFVVNATKLPVRHGWKEAGGVRRIGEYGNVFHSGGCPGEDYPAYQVSCEGTKAHLEVVEDEIKQLTEILAELDTRPTLEDYDKVACGHDRQTYRTIYAHYGFRISAGEKFSITPDSTKPYDYRDYDYERTWRKHHHHYAGQKRSAEHRKAILVKAIKVWEPNDLAPRKPKGPVVHHSASTRGTICGSASYYVTTTDKREEVTCSHCLKTLESWDAENAQLEAEKADAKDLAAWLSEHGPAPVKKLKAEMGWDQKRLNKAKERSEHGRNYDDPGRIHTDSSKPAKWFVRRIV